MTDTPLCRDCKHCWARSVDPMGLAFDWHNAKCRAASHRDPVTGQPTQACRYERREGTQCGPNGLLFEPKFNLLRWLRSVWRATA
jgi:hypothetical protein